ncbi:MAG: PKD domain-containing protein [Woeseiaceae bacterium]|nr:PKD domain-containing protein [Woeseiaceae bacterium]
MYLSLRSASFIAVSGLVAFFGMQDAEATGTCTATFSEIYPASETEDLGDCQTCHQSAFGGPFNAYGADLVEGRPNLSCESNDFATALSAVEALDSDGDGNSNLVEINASTQPGWCDETQSDTCTNTEGTPPDVALDPMPANEPPIAVVGGPYGGEAGTSIQFDGSASSDPDNDPLSYSWDFGDGDTTSGATPTHTYASAGNYRVTLIVNDGTVDSEPSMTTAEITSPSANLAPTADPGGPYAAEPDQLIKFDGSASSDPNGDPLTYSWDFGDGNTGSGAMPTHSYAATGIYTVSLVVNDGEFDSLIATTTATIEAAPANRPPVADVGGPYSGETGMAVEFDGRDSSDPDGDALSYVWDFGDGNVGDGATPVHTYGMAGTYEVTLVVNDGEFDSEVSATTATIEDPAEPDDGEALYIAACASCHGDPWNGPAVDEMLSGLRRVAGARSCNIYGSIFGTSVFPNGVPEMQFLQGLTESEIAALADYLNSEETTGEQRYVTTCAGCHGNTGAGGRVDEDVHGDSAEETFEAIEEDEEMHYLACMPESDIFSIAEYLMGMDDDYDDDGVSDDDDSDDDNDGIHDDYDSDDDNDSVDDDEEREGGTDPRDEDTDDDGLDDGEERDHGTDPNDSDSDNDGVSDGDEVNHYGTNPLVANASFAEQPQSSGGGSAGMVLLLSMLLLAIRRRLPI